MSELDPKPPIKETTDSQSTIAAPSSSPFDDVLREAFGRPSSNNDSVDGRQSEGGRANDVLPGPLQPGAGTDISQPGRGTSADAEAHGGYLDMETGQIVGGTNRGFSGADSGTEKAKPEAEKNKKTGDPSSDTAAPTEASTKPSPTETPDDDGEDFALLKKHFPDGKNDKPKVDDEPDFNLVKGRFPKNVDGEKPAAGEKPATDGTKQPTPEGTEKQKADEAEKKKFAELPNYKPEQNRNRRHETSMEKMTGWLNKNFDTLDGDKNGTITREELGKQMENPALANGESGVYLATAYGAAGTWKNVADELTGKKPEVKKAEPTEGIRQAEPASLPKAKTSDPNIGITRDGIQAVRDNLGKFDSKELKERHAIKSLNNDFQNLDTNKDKNITMAELDSALTDESIGKEQREKLETLKRNFKEVAATTDDVIKKVYTNGSSAGSDPQKPTLDGKPLKDVEFVSELDLGVFKNSDAVSLQNSLENHTKHLESDQPITQGQTGSCFVLAPVAAILDKDPTFFDDKIKDLGDGRLQVRLPENDGKYRSLNTVITKPTDAERARFGGGETAAILEKAFSQNLKTLLPNKPGAVQEQIHDGGNEHAAIRSLTGNQSSRTSPQEEEEKVREQLSLVGDANKGLTAGTNEEVPEGSGLMPKHVYTVSGFDKNTGEVELINPHKGDFGGAIEPTKRGGSARDGKFDGKFKISFTEFKDHFAEINSFDIRKK
jgi:Ca2+-binding EF-hand superfamily protein